MLLKIALAGNPNSGKTTLFNALTGSTQYVGNWPGVTVEKKEGKLKLRRKEATVIDLPGIYSLSPYTLEEVIARDYILGEKPDVVINIIDASNLERNLYLTTQIIELGVPTVVALNMMDIVDKRHDVVDTAALSKKLGCPVAKISAVKGVGIDALVDMALSISDAPTAGEYAHDIEGALSGIAAAVHGTDAAQGYDERWLALKLLERDENLLGKVVLSDAQAEKIESFVRAIEEKQDDDIESIMTNARYDNVAALLADTYIRQQRPKLSVSDKIDKVLTNRVLALPIFFLIMWGIYYIAIQTVGDWTIGWVQELIAWVSGLVVGAMESGGAAPWLISLVDIGIFGGIGGVLVFVPQLMILYMFISLLEDCGYMARVAFIMDRVFRRFGLSGKSFIPMLIGTGCSVPGIMASRTIENEKDRKMTIMLTPFIPCGAKLPVFALFVAMVFRNASWIGPSMYLIGIVMVILSGIILKRTRLFSGKPAPFIMELPSYKLPRVKGVLVHMWEKGKSFIIKAGTVIFVASAAIWFLQAFSFSLEYLGDGGIENSMLAGLGRVLAPIFAPLGFGNWPAAVATVTGLVAKEVVVSTFAILSAVTPVAFTPASAFAFMIFTLLAAPCAAAIGATRREMGGWKWTLIAIGYQTGLAYVMAMLVNQIGSLLFPGSAIVLSFGAQAQGESAASGIAILQNPMVYILAAIVLAVAVVKIVGVSRRSKDALLSSKT